MDLQGEIAALMAGSLNKKQPVYCRVKVCLSIVAVTFGTVAGIAASTFFGGLPALPELAEFVGATIRAR